MLQGLSEPKQNTDDSVRAALAKKASLFECSDAHKVGSGVIVEQKQMRQQCKPMKKTNKNNIKNMHHLQSNK